VKTSGGIFNWRAFKYKPFSLYTLAVFTCFFGLYTRKCLARIKIDASQPGFNTYTVLTYIDVSATNAGIAPSFDVYLLAIANASSGVGRIMTGLLADRIGSVFHSEFCETINLASRLHVCDDSRHSPGGDCYLCLAFRGKPTIPDRRGHHLWVGTIFSVDTKVGLHSHQVRIGNIRRPAGCAPNPYGQYV
jgi:hypothetical protein